MCVPEEWSSSTQVWTEPGLQAVWQAFRHIKTEQRKNFFFAKKKQRTFFHFCIERRGANRRLRRDSAESRPYIAESAQQNVIATQNHPWYPMLAHTGPAQLEREKAEPAK